MRAYEPDRDAHAVAGIISRQAGGTPSDILGTMAGGALFTLTLESGKVLTIMVNPGVVLMTSPQPRKNQEYQ